MSLKGLLWLREQHGETPEDPCDESVVTEGGGIKVKYEHVPACMCVHVSFV